MAYKYRLVENEDEGNFIRPKADNNTIVLTVPEEKSEEVEAAFKNINNYGDYKSNFRQNPGSSEDYFGPRGSPNVKKSLENKFKEIQQQYDNEKDRRNEFINIFGKKQKNPGAKYDTLKSNNGKFFEKTNKATTDAFDATQKTSPLPKFEIEGNKLKFDNEGIIEKYIKTVMKNIGVDIKDYTISKKEELKKPTKESKEKELRLLIREEIKKTLNEGALLSAINPGLQGEVKTPVMKLESYLETLGAKLDYKKLGYIIQDIIDAAQHDYQMMRNKD